MPANYAHYRFGKDVLKTMPAEARQCVTRFRRMYDLGLHGPDIFFYHNPFWTDPVVKLGIRFHQTGGADFFPTACKAAVSEAARAYLYGLLGHYCLDSCCHPFVNRLASIGEAEHAVLEAEFDRCLLLMDGEGQPEAVDVCRGRRLTRGECMTVAGFYPGTTGANVSFSVKNLTRATKFLSKGHGRKLLQKLSPFLARQRIPAVENEELTLYVRELKSLYAAALERYPVLLEKLLIHMAGGDGLGEDFLADFG